MTDVIRIEGTQGDIRWLLPKELSERFTIVEKVQGKQAKDDALKALTSYLSGFTHLLYGSTMLLPDDMLNTLDLIATAITTIGKISLARAKGGLK